MLIFFEMLEEKSDDVDAKHTASARTHRKEI